MFDCYSIFKKKSKLQKKLKKQNKNLPPKQNQKSHFIKIILKN